MPSSSLLFRGATLMTPSGAVEADLRVEGGIIAAIGDRVAEVGDTEIQCDGLYILPGLIDAHVHFREPGLTHKECFATGSEAAVAGGVTTYLDMPNVKPSTTTLEALEARRVLAAASSLCHFGFHFGTTQDNLAACREVRNVPSLKVFMGSSTGNMLVDREEQLAELFALGRLLTLHAEDEACIREGTRKWEGHHEPWIHSHIRSNSCAQIAVERAAGLAARFGTPIHIGHLSTREELEVIHAFPDLHITCEVAPHHLFLTDQALREMGNYAKMNPPLRSAADVEALWEGLREGTATLVATDHAPHLREEKERDYWEAPSGVPGVQTMLPLLLEAVHQGRFTLERLVEVTAAAPAKVFHLQGKGRLEPGADADLAIINLDEPWEIRNEQQLSRCGWTPYHGWKVRGRVAATYVLGELAFDGMEVRKEVRGQEVKAGLSTDSTDYKSIRKNISNIQ